MSGIRFVHPVLDLLNLIDLIKKLLQLVKTYIAV